MSVKDDLNAVKQELNTEEQFLESLIKTERVLKKYKYPLIIGVLLIVLAFVVVKVNDYVTYQKKLTANRAYLAIEKNPNDKKAREILKEKNPKLYNLLIAREQMNRGEEIKNIDGVDEIQKSLINYFLASKSEKIEPLSTYANSDIALIKDFAILQEGFLFLKKGKREVALNKFSEISVDSPLKPIAEALSHYKITEVKEIAPQTKDVKKITLPNLTIPKEEK